MTRGVGQRHHATERHAQHDRIDDAEDIAECAHIIAPPRQIPVFASAVLARCAYESPHHARACWRASWARSHDSVQERRRAGSFLLRVGRLSALNLSGSNVNARFGRDRAALSGCALLSVAL